MDRLKKSGSEINPASLGDVVAGPGMAAITGVTKALLGQIKEAMRLAHGYECVVGLATLSSIPANTDTQATFSFLTSKELPTRTDTMILEDYVADTPRLMPVMATANRQALTLNNCDAFDYFRYNASILIGNTGSNDASVTVTIGAYNAAGEALLETARTHIVPAGSYTEFNFIDGGSSPSLQYLKVKVRTNVAGPRINNLSRILIECKNRGLTASDVFNE